MSNQPPTTSHRALTGFVTKLVGDGATYGFINDEIFFPQTNVSGGPACVGDQVFAECEYSAHLPIKWNATAVKILNKAGGQQQPPNNSRSDQQQQQQSEMMNQQQQQQQFNPSGSVAVTYQQHRQQRQQRQMLDVNKQPDNNVKQQQSHQQNTDLTAKLLEHTNNPSGEYFDPGQSQLFPQQMEQGNIQPFHDQPPMGPPNFTYTSQLGSAFVQNQFVPVPFMAQQPPPMLPPQQQQPPQQQPPQHLLPNNQSMQNQNNQRHNNKGGGRFNNQGEKNERQNNRRNQNRNDNNKFDRPKSGDRDGGAHNNNNNNTNNNNSNNNRQQKSNGGRDRSSGRNNRRDDPPARPSPPAHSSARSTTSLSSDRGAKSRRHYEVQNIPKARIMTNMNAYNMKQRCPSSVHVPSDLKNIIVNKYFRLDIKNTPKPIRYTIEQPKSDMKTEEVERPKPDQSDNVPTKKEAEDVAENQGTGIAMDEPKILESNTAEVKTEQEKQDVKPQEQPTPPSSKSDIRLNHKYGVKVILLSLPELESIYHSVFGQNLDSFNHDSRSTHSRLDEAISMLCNKGQNNGHSLVGGKFDPVVDGFIEGQINEFERHGRQPDLIATCKRVVHEQTGLDLANCRGWTLLSTFIYNNKSDYFSPKASVEYSFIYMPQIWTMLSDKFDETIMRQESLQAPIKEALPTTENQLVESSETSAMDVDDSAQQQPEVGALDKDDNSNNAATSSTPSEAMATINPDNLAELKVSDLKAELDKREIKYKTGAKKADLISLLHESLQPTQTSQSEQSDEAQKKEGDGTEVAADPIEPTPTAAAPQLEEGEVEAGHSEDSPDTECEAATTTEEVVSKNKRTGSEAEVEEPESSKKVCTGGSPVKEKRFELIQETFKVRARDEQQQLSLVSLYEAAQASRHDQFELSVASNILKESLVQHLSEYILTALVEDNKQKLSTVTGAPQSNSSSQETNSDTNNNSTSKSTFKNPTSTSSSSEAKVGGCGLKEFPIDRYINLAFSYFDSTHMGYVYFEDLNKLFNNTGLTISKRALMSLVGDGEKFNYKTLPGLSSKLPPTYIYEFPEQFNVLPLSRGPSSSTTSGAGDGHEKNLPTASSSNNNNFMVEYKGVMYDVAQLVQQVREAETLRVSMVDRFNYAIENSDRQAEEIHVLEVSQKSLSKAIKHQNDEICDLKRERDTIKKKFDSVRKGIKGTVTSLSDLIKED